jgi:hypothetical protein
MNRLPPPRVTSAAHPASIASLAGLLLLAACALSLSGCYERTINARGIGAINKNIQKPYRSETVLDKAVDASFGQQRPPTSRSR